MEARLFQCSVLLVLCLILSCSFVSAQQNLFNVPSSDITLKAKPFFQQQINFSKGLVQFNSTFSYGVGKNLEIGFNILGVDVSTGSSSFLKTNQDVDFDPVYPFFTFNAQKAWVLNSIFKLAIGTQTGFSKGGHFGTYDYSNLVTAVKKTKTKIIAGLYYGTKTFLGPGERNHVITEVGDDEIGIQTGLEQELFDGDLLLILENISGKHSLGETSTGLAYYLSKH